MSHSERPEYGQENTSYGGYLFNPPHLPDPSWRDKFDNDPTNGDWRDDLLVVVGVVCLLAFFTTLALARMAGRLDVLFYAGITLFVIGIYVRVAGKKGH